jgi:hypothetical protein
MSRSISRKAFKALETLLFGLVFICLLMAWTVPARAGWQRDMVLGNPGPAQPSAPVYTGPTAEQIVAQQAAQQAAQEAAAREAQRQATIRQAHAANDAGLSFWKRHEWGAAVEQFRQALAKSPGDKVIQSNLTKATEQLRQEQWQETRKQEDSNMASQMSATLQQLTAGMPDFDGHNAGPAPATGTSAALDFMPAGNTAPSRAIDGQTNGRVVQSQPTSWQDPNVVDLRGTTKTSVDPTTVNGKTAPTPANANGLNFMPANNNTTSVAQNQAPIGDPNVVDLRGTSKTSVDPAAMKNTGFAQPADFRKNAPPPPGPNVQLPQNQDIELLGRPPSKPKGAWPGEERPANQPKLLNPLDKEKETQELANAIFESPAMEDLMLKKIQEDAIAYLNQPNSAAPKTQPPAPASPANGLPLEKSAGPHN